MKKYFFILFLFSWCNASVALEIFKPVLKPEAVLEQTQAYLIKERAIDIEKYQLSLIVFNYYARYGTTPGKWVLHYSCKPINGIYSTDCGFSVQVSNETKPTFEFVKTDA
ncbi:hypothetical protein GCM10011613_30510 [Cellvibrio zantedeschiae]|uniref:Uncharacterized protein n=1 Tax=Cellvibrio zantedeschiae TaxID=1237077 RepID=A0ABQ3BAT9_9GAMM|nr:hypothetical protein [Cellvibrio zantedeschiae]GGY83511.1 hypothetical protein GCM10011613_30510 [Cellvibrio zantedeschiae]